MCRNFVGDLEADETEPVPMSNRAQENALRAVAERAVAEMRRLPHKQFDVADLIPYLQMARDIR